MRHIAIFLIRMYQSIQSSFYVGSCRFHPTCSHYAVEAFESRGFFIGVMLTAYRLVRCQPFCKGGWDPVPRSLAPRGPAPQDPVPRDLAPRDSVSRDPVPKHSSTTLMTSSAENFRSIF